MSQMAITTRRERDKGLPRTVLFGAVALIGFALAAAGFSKLSGVGAVRLAHGAAVETLLLRFDDRADGGVDVRDANDDKIIYVVAPGTDYFIRATLRGLAQERLRSDVGREIPFTLTHWSDGTLSLVDPSDGRNVALEVFGPTNAQAFAKLFDARRAAQ
jgi:putative photosynthetic complex assembly protein